MVYDIGMSSVANPWFLVPYGSGSVPLTSGSGSYFRQ